MKSEGVDQETKNLLLQNQRLHTQLKFATVQMDGILLFTYMDLTVQENIFSYVYGLFFILLSYHTMDFSEIKLTPCFSNKNLSGNDVDRFYDHSYTTDIFGYVYIQWRH